jgi:predicted nucleic acid-binding protein
MTLVDTTVWIDFLNGRDVRPVQKLENLIKQEEDLCTCGIIFTEVLRGIREDKGVAQTEAMLNRLIYFPLPKGVFTAAARIYRLLRKKGVTIRNPVDTVIAAVCLEHGLRLLHNDRDFDLIARHFPLKIY